MNTFPATYLFRNEIVDHVAWKRHCAITKKNVLSSELFQRFIVVYQTIIGVNFNSFIICYDWWCHFPFYTPVWKTDVLCYGNVRPSVRPSFPDFFSTCFEISISNLVYAFSRWHDMSSLSFITIGSLWPSLQPNVGQTQFLQSWPYKSR